MIKRMFLFLTLLGTVLTVGLLVRPANAQSAPQRPFPQHVTYAPGTIRPTNFTQSQLDGHVRTFYDYWKAAYLTAAGTNSSGQTLYRVRFGKSGTKANATVSEGQGYGMVITALMAGYDPNAQAYFDGLWRFARAYPSGIDNRLMSWKVVNGVIVEGNASAFDGDADIAYGLLLAHAQWGSNGAINYQAAANQVLDGVLASTIGPQSHLPTLGDWVSPNGSAHSQYTPRSSDFMLAHFRTFARATNNPVWNTVATNVQGVIDRIQSTHSTTTGLLPDFMINCNPITNCLPSPAQFLEGPHDGHYYYNAGRNPWRIGVDVLLNANPAAQRALQKTVRWLAGPTASGGNAQTIKAGYQLDGTPIDNYFTTFFVAPFGVAAMTDPTQQAFLNNIYASVYNTREDYYEDSVNLMALLVMTGNYWDPAPASVTPTATPLTPFPTATPTAMPTPTATPVSGTCLVTYRVDPDWGSGFTANLTVTNLTGAVLPTWTLTWAFPDNQQITAAWSSSVTQSGNSVQARNVSWNGNVAPGASFTVGFNANYSGSNRIPTTFALNGAPCNLNNATPTPLPTNTVAPTATSQPTVTPTPTNSNALIFADGFETGNLNNWSARVIDGGDLSVSAGAALVGSFGMSALIDDNLVIHVTDDRPNGEPSYQVRIRFDPNSMTMASGDLYTLFYGYTGTSTQVLRLELRFSAGLYQLRAALRDDATTWRNSAFFTITDAPHLIQLDWRAATVAGANNGSLAFRIDGGLKANLTGVDNDTWRIDRVQLGAVLGIDTGTRGSAFFDAFESYRLPIIVAAALVAEEQPEDGSAFLEEVTAEELTAEAEEAMSKQLFLPLIVR